MAVAKLDSNSRPTLIAVSSSDSSVIVPLYADPTTHRLLVDSASSSAITVGTTTITSGTTTRILYDNAGVVGEYTLTGTGTVVAMQTSPTFVTPTLGTAGSTALGVGKSASASIRVEVKTDGTFTQGVRVEGDVTTRLGFSAFVTGDAQVRYTQRIDGLMGWGDGTSVTDTNLYRSAVNTLKTDNTLLVGTPGTVAGSVVTIDGTQTLTSKTLTSPTLTTPSLGVATATSINGNVFTTGSSTYTGTAGQTYTFPSTTSSIARTDAAQTFTGTQTFAQANLTANAITASSNAATIPITSGRNIVTNNSAATLTITLTTTSAVNMQTCMVQILDFSGVAQTLSFVNTENSTVSVPSTTNGSTTLPLTVGFVYNSATTKWRCIATA